MDRLRAMEVFVRVVEAGGLSKAARSLDLPRSSVSMTVQALERHLGVRLLHRSPRHISPTADGRAYYLRCLDILAEVASTEAGLRQPSDSPHGRLRVDLPGAIATAMVLPALSGFRASHPGIDLAIGLNDRRVDLVQDGIDCVIRTGELGDSSLIARRIGRFNWITCAAPDYLDRRGVPVHPAELARHDVVGYFADGGPVREKWLFGRAGQRTEVTVSGAVAVNETLAYLMLGTEGYGFIRVAHPIAAPYLERGSLVEVLQPYRPDPVPVSVLYPTARHLSPVVRVFVDWIAGLFPQAE